MLTIGRVCASNSFYFACNYVLSSTRRVQDAIMCVLQSFFWKCLISHVNTVLRYRLQYYSHCCRKQSFAQVILFLIYSTLKIQVIRITEWCVSLQRQSFLQRFFRLAIIALKSTKSTSTSTAR